MPPRKKELSPVGEWVHIRQGDPIPDSAHTCTPPTVTFELAPKYAAGSVWKCPCKARWVLARLAPNLADLEATWRKLCTLCQGRGEYFIGGSAAQGPCPSCDAKGTTKETRS